MIDEKRLIILTESAKFDVSCSSSGSNRKNVDGGLGNACFSGICHSFTQDGRCISLLKMLMSNDCVYNCQYCINRCTNNTNRATATPKEICELVIEFYKRNYIEGLFLSSAIVKNPNYTMEQLYLTAKMLRTEYHFNGYIHLKGIPSADKTLIEMAGFYADRMSFNIELPSENSLKLLAPQKNKTAIIEPMKMLALDKYYDSPLKRRSDFLPAGQTTQMIVGASPETDNKILKLTDYLYNTYKMKRVYYSSYIPTNFDNSNLPYIPTPKIREHRLYQADWLLRFYKFSIDELTFDNGNLSTLLDPKCAWAMHHLDLFPVEINTVNFDMLIRVPGIGVKTALRIVSARKYNKITFEALKQMRVVLKRAKHFITCQGKFYGASKEEIIKENLITNDNIENATQLSFMPKLNEVSLSVLTGEL